MKVFRVEAAQDDAYDELVALLRSGGVVAFPTDTAYGLGADPFNEGALDRIYQIKGRSEMKPILVLVDSLEMAETVIEPADNFYTVAGKFWPGPLTVIAPGMARLPANLTAGTGKIGLRWPNARFATALVKRFGKPVTATSANRSGHPAAITPDEVRAQLDESIDALVDGGALPARCGSTVLDLTVDPPALLREGPITFEQLAAFFEGRLRRQVA